MEAHEGLISKAPREIPDNGVSKKLDCGLLDVISRGDDEGDGQTERVDGLGGDHSVFLIWEPFIG